MAPATRPLQRSERRPAPGRRSLGHGPDAAAGPRARAVAHRARPRAPPVYVDLLPPCNAAARPARTSRPGSRMSRPGVRGRLARARRRQPTRGDPRPRLLPPVRERLQPRAARQRGLDPLHRAVPRRPGDRAGLGVRYAVRPDRQARAGVGAGPERALGRLPPGPLGHEVEIRDAGAEAGGMMRFGIPAYRLPREVLDAEVERIAELGVRFTSTTGSRISSRSGDEGGFDAVFVAVGAHLAKRVDIPARDAGPILDAVALLRSVAAGERPQIGRRVAVYGGGNTAMDAARVAQRLGAEEAMIVYRRTREQMPAHAEEAEDAEREGVRINWLRTITAFDGPELQIEVMELDEAGPAADRSVRDAGRRRRRARARPGGRHRVSRPRAGRRGRPRRRRQVSPSLMTDRPGLFAGGDMVPGERSVTVGVATARRPPATSTRSSGARLRRASEAHTASFDKLTSGTSPMPPQAQPEQPPEERGDGLRRGGRRARRGGGGLRGEAVPVVRQLLRVRRLPRRLPRGRRDQARQRAPLSFRLRPVHRLRGVLRAVPRARDRHGRGDAL